MNEHIIIRLGSQPEQSISWLVWAPLTQEVIASGEIAAVSELPQLAARLGSARAVVALVPAADVLLKKVALPAKPNKQLLQALPYMLEEEQAEDIDKLYIALGKVEQLAEQYWQQVAICQRHRLEQWLGWLQEAGFKVVRLVPDALLLPATRLPCCIELQQQWLLRQDEWQATSIESGWWPDYLALAQLPQVLSYSPWPAHVQHLHDTAAPELPLALLAKGLNETDFNLLQGSYAPKRAQNRYWQQWKLTAMIGGLCCLLYFVQLGTEVYQQKQQLAATEQQLRALYLETFPNDRIVNLSRQVRQKLQTVGAGKQEPHFLNLLAVLQQRLEKLPDLKLDSLRYDASRQELRFGASAAGFQSFEQLKSQLEQAGYQVEQGALSNDGNRVQGSVVMRGAV
ncbi:type II secretion system protein GspL [Alishewanella sp. 16-MA]|uniref:Type II secretion system protein L n=1 Tax=Alishewanella maricola TaxID=2795740 RepID=A0ABS8C4K3_9ALTE|nr:type II secretion system protein GspL [Alishewanella maricola]MCB5227246.1 type II secretion system protein GspL [Alishewanella maricola]MDP4945596.1 type II secretion system protein GspL [Alishewanella sp.]MDP5035830.1 type II secretion system protein GspL [Alishewanella sp.]MDP5186942.1 type II secretion system protein GspL [Alishewanella sp.]